MLVVGLWYSTPLLHSFIYSIFIADIYLFCCTMEKDDYSSLKIILWLILFLLFGIIIIT